MQKANQITTLIIMIRLPMPNKTKAKPNEHSIPFEILKKYRNKTRLLFSLLCALHQGYLFMLLVLLTLSAFILFCAFCRLFHVMVHKKELKDYTHMDQSLIFITVWIDSKRTQTGIWYSLGLYPFVFAYNLGFVLNYFLFEKDVP